MSASLWIAGVQDLLPVQSFKLREALGTVWSAEVEFLSSTPLSLSELPGRGAMLRLDNDGLSRLQRGLIVRAEVSAVGEGAGTVARRYRVVLKSPLHLLSLRRRSQVFQHLSVPDIIGAVLEQSGLRDALTIAVKETHEPRRYLTQYDETDLAFVHRLLEEEGLHLRFESAPETGKETMVLEDDSRLSPKGTVDKLLLIDDAERHRGGDPVAWNLVVTRRERAGRVLAADHDHERPAVELRKEAQTGLPSETALVVYEAAAGFKDPAHGDKRARARLEAARHDASEVRFSTNTLTLRPGICCVVTPHPEYAGASMLDGEITLLAVEHAWTATDARHEAHVTAIAREQRYRLPRRTPRPHIAGAHTAHITGPIGQEIHTDELGRVTVRFPWDRTGKSDERSSLPVRVLQANMPGSLITPRIGWEVITAFEDGNPDKPYVLGRVYNATQPPPMALPAHKTVTTFSTASSPGAGGQNTILFEDSNGAQHMAWTAQFGKSVSVASNMKVHTGGKESLAVKGAQNVTVGASESISVGVSLMETAGSQVQAVSGSHTVKINGNMGINTGPETVVVGGALLEQVGNPVQGAIHLGVSALTTALSFAAGGDSALGKALEAGLKYGAGVVLNTAINTALAYNDGGEEAAKDALAAGLQEGVMHAASELTHLPGLDALETAVKSALPAFKGPPEVAKKAGKPVGATTGDATQAGGGQGGPGPGHRVNMVNGAMTEAIGGPHVYATPGLNKWTTVGACTIVVGGSHNIRAAKVSSRTAGALEDASGSLNITAGAAIVRKAKASVSRNISGAMSWKAGGIIAAHGSSASLSVGGALKAKGSNVVFVCGGSVFAVTPGGVVLKSSSVTFNGVTVSTGKWVLP